MKIIGTSPDSIDRAEDRKRFNRLVEKLKLRQPRSGTAKTYAVSYVWKPLEAVAAGHRRMPDEYINAEGNGITEAFRDYALPLVDRFPRLGWLKGKPI